MSGIASASRPGGRTLLCKQPARLLMIDLSPPFSTDVGHDVCEALENMFSLACNLSGPTRIPFFGVMALYNYPELLLPFSYVRNNFPRIQTAIYDIRNMIENLVQSDQSSSCIEQGLLEACSHYRCQLQSTLQTGGFGHQLEIVIVTCQSGTSTQKQVEATSLDLEQLKRIQIVCLSSLGSLMDNLSQTSLSSDHSSTNSISGIVEIINLEPEYLCIQNFFNGWLLDTGTDSEHLHIILPPSQPDVLQYIASKNLPKVDQTIIPEPSPPPAVGTAQSVEPVFIAPPLPMMDAEEFIDIPNTAMRSTIAKRLTESKTTIPHSYATIDCNVGPVTKLRKQLADKGVKVSVNDFIIKAAAIALQRVPQVNSVWQGEEIHAMSNVDISVAVATKSGLITPIVKNTPYLSVDEISDTVKDLATRAKGNKLQLHEFQGGTFTISNLGMFGITEFSAVINPPQTAIMAIGSSRVYIGSEGKPESRMNATLSYDARIVDATDASNYLEVFRDLMENPQMTVVGSNLSRKLSAEL